MSLARPLRKLSYNPWFIRTVRTLRLRGPARKIYHRLTSSREGTLEVQRGGVSAKFFTQTPEHLRLVEASSMESSLELLVRFLRLGDTVHDIGSNLGLYAVLLAKAVGAGGSVVAFEPHHETFCSLLKNISLNQLSNVIPFEKALGEKACRRKLYVGSVNANFSLFREGIVGPRNANVPSQWVDVVQGDEFVQSRNLPVPRAVKIDVEGYEYSVIKGLARTLAAPACKMICCEVHPKFMPDGVSFDEICNLLGSLGYSRIEADPNDEPFHMVAYKS